MINETLTMNTTCDTLTTVYDAFNVLPFFIAIILIGCLFCYVGIPRGSDEDDPEDITDEPQEKPRHKRKPNPEQILKERLANGDITPEDYTDRMSRL